MYKITRDAFQQEHASVIPVVTRQLLGDYYRVAMVLLGGCYGIARWLLRC